jgi:uncharacterized membrane protein
VFGLAFALTLPSLGGYDEGVHFLRAWHLSNGHAFAQSGHRDNDPAPDLGAYVPAGLENQLRAILIDGVLNRHDARGAWSHVNDPAPRGPKLFVDFAATAVYPPVPYVPAAIGIRIGRLFGASSFVLVLLARLAELAAFIAVVALAIRRLPSRAWIFTVLALTPVALFQASAVSADALTTAFALVVVADAFALMAQPVDRVPRGLLIETALVTVALALSKQPYFLAAALLLLPAWKHRRSIAVAIGAILTVSGALALAWARWANAHYLAPDFLPPSLGGHANYANNNVQPTAQVKYLRGHPFAFFGAVWRMITDYGPSIAHDLVAQTSFWHVPTLIAALIACGVVGIVVVEWGPLAGGRVMRAAALALAAVMVVVSLLLAYVGWNALRAPRLDGYQGRYLLLVLAIVALALLPDRAMQPENSSRSSIASRVRVHRDAIALGLVGWMAVMLLAVELGLAWHSYG